MPMTKPFRGFDVNFNGAMPLQISNLNSTLAKIGTFIGIKDSWRQNDQRLVLEGPQIGLIKLLALPYKMEKLLIHREQADTYQDIWPCPLEFSGLIFGRPERNLYPGKSK